MVMLPSTSQSFNDTQSSSFLNLTNVEQKKHYHRFIDALSQLDKESVDNSERVVSTLQVVNDTRELASAAAANANQICLGTVLLDSYVLRQAGQQALTAVSNIEVNTNAYSASELANHILENPSWWQFRLPKCVSSSATLHGAFEPTAPPVRVRAPRRRADPNRNAAAPRKPDNIAAVEKRGEDTTMVSRVRRWMKARCRLGPLSLWHAVLHPTDFAASVHNVYYVSFLVRDGLLEIYIDEELGIPMVRPIASAQRPERDIAREQQFVVSLDMHLWQTLVEACGITEPMMTFDEVC